MIRRARRGWLWIGLAGLAVTLPGSDALSALPRIPGHVVAGRGSTVKTYTTSTVVMSRGASASFHNYDVQPHDVTSDVPGLFGSDTVGIGKTVPILGVSSLEPAKYSFHCSVHEYMRGTLNVRPHQ